MRIKPSALTHGITEEDILHTDSHRAYESEPDDDVPAKQFVLGWAARERLLELAILTFDSGHRLVIPTMKARRSMLTLLD